MSQMITDLYHAIVPPRKTGMFVVQSAVTGAAAASMDWSGSGGLAANAPKGKVFLCVEALTTPVYIRFGPTSTTATTTSNGLGIAAGTRAYFYVDPIDDRYIDHISSGAGVIKVQVCSQIGERRYV